MTSNHHMSLASASSSTCLFPEHQLFYPMRAGGRGRTQVEAVYEGQAFAPALHGQVGICREAAGLVAHHLEDAPAPRCQAPSLLLELDHVTHQQTTCALEFGIAPIAARVRRAGPLTHTHAHVRTRMHRCAAMQLAMHLQL